MLSESRYLSLKHWLATVLSPKDGCSSIQLSSMTGDAGFRQYYRFHHDGVSFIAVDAPPSLSNNDAFVALQQSLASQNICVPQIIACDLTQGFFCLSDFGDYLLADLVKSEKESALVKSFYMKAINMLPSIAKARILPTNDYKLPIYDRAFIQLELSIFTDWLLSKHLNIKLTANDQRQLESCFSLLVDSALDQPQVTMHRDYHSRNIMILEDKQLGVIDFQDAVTGPITYDIVSLLRDCYVRYSDEMVTSLFTSFCRLMETQYSLTSVSDEQWNKWFDFMGLQRHLKASGIFCRLYYRDNKEGYLKDVPLTLSYIENISSRYPALRFIHQLITEKVQPAMNKLHEQPSCHDDKPIKK